MKRAIKKYWFCFWLCLLLTGCQESATIPSDAGDRAEAVRGVKEEGEGVKKEDGLDIRGLRVSCIDVGKGDCILLQTKTYTLLLDTGYEQTADRVITYLKENGVSRIDTMVITHFDKDHEGGAAGILSAFSVGKIYLPDYTGHGEQYRKMVAALQKSDAGTERVSDRVFLEADGVAFTVESSGIVYDAWEENDNDLSLLLKAEYGKDSYLFTGDLEKKGIKAFLEREEGRHYDVCKLPHHGDGNKKTDDLLDSVTPKIVLVTDGEEEPMEDEVCALLTQRQTDYYTSLQNGTIVIEGDGNGNYKISKEK